MSNVSEPTISLLGDVVVVTGSGRGIGREHALHCASLGARVVVNDSGAMLDGKIGTSPAEEVAQEIRQRGGEAVASNHSIDDPEQAREIIDLAMDTFGSVESVVHNAGILRDRSFTNLSDDDIERVLQVHLVGAFNVLRPAVKVMREKSFGRIVLTASASGLLGTFGQSNYGAAKMGLVGLMNVLAVEGASKGIRVNTIAPSARTRMTEDLLGPLADALDPAHISPLVAYLCSRKCDLSHEIFAVGGGRYARMFVGVTPGWCIGKNNIATVEDIALNIDEIRRTDQFVIPYSGEEEMQFLKAAIESEKAGPVQFRNQ